MTRVGERELKCTYLNSKSIGGGYKPVLQLLFHFIMKQEFISIK